MSRKQPIVDPESLAALQQRYPAAVSYVYDVEAVVAGGIRPGEIAANVFIADDGLHLVISRERMPDGSVRLHFSASFTEGGRIHQEIKLLARTTPKRELLRMWLDSIPARFAELSGDARPATFLGVGPGFIPHWIIEEET